MAAETPTHNMGKNREKTWKTTGILALQGLMRVSHMVSAFLAGQLNGAFCHTLTPFFHPRLLRVMQPLCCTPRGRRRATWRRTSSSTSARWTPSWRDTLCRWGNVETCRNVSVWRSFIPTNQHVCIHTTFLTWGQLSCLMVSSTRSKITPSPCMFRVKLDCSSSPVLHVAFCQTLSSHRLFWLWGNLLTASKNLEILIWRDQRNVCRWMQPHWSMQPFDMFLSAVPL